MTLKVVTIKRFRSLKNITIKATDNNLAIICGENNIGKTNFLRALNLFFNHPEDDSLFCPEIDLPNHIYHGSRGDGMNTEMQFSFLLDSKLTTWKIKFYLNKPNAYSYKNEGDFCSSNLKEFKFFIKQYKFIFIESSNINIPNLVSEIFASDGLIAMDKIRNKQKEALNQLKIFQTHAQTTLSNIEKSLNDIFEGFTDFDGTLSGKKIKINFAEFEKLRDVVSRLADITLYDGTDSDISTKGSGAQRVVFLTLMKYIAEQSTKNVIWGIDEPEVFLQPKLQKQAFKVIKSTSNDPKQQVFITTHSQHFINISDLDGTYLFQPKLEKKEYTRLPGKTFYELDTLPVEFSNSTDKAKQIKEHLGIDTQDSWEVLPSNILVEGETDKKYLEAMMSSLNISVPNFIYSSGASKMNGYIQFYDMLGLESGYKAKIKCVFDDDDAGNKSKNDIDSIIKKNKFKNIEVDTYSIVRHDGYENTKAKIEIEDFLHPELFFDALNKVLRKFKYKVITVADRKKRSQAAYINESILDFSSSIIKNNNPDKKPIELAENDGYKKLICQYFLEEDFNHFEITATQKNLLTMLSVF